MEIRYKGIVFQVYIQKKETSKYFLRSVWKSNSYISICSMLSVNSPVDVVCDFR